MIVHYKFAILIPKTFPLEMAGPVMCAGVTMFSPLQNLGCKNGSNVAIVGLGGLNHNIINRIYGGLYNNNL